MAIFSLILLLFIQCQIPVANANTYSSSLHPRLSNNFKPLALPSIYSQVGQSATLHCSGILSSLSDHWNYIEFHKGDGWRSWQKTQLRPYHFFANMTIEWLYDQITLKNSNDKYNIQEVINENICQITTKTKYLFADILGQSPYNSTLFKCMTSTLIIKNISNEDYGNYICRIKNIESSFYPSNKQYYITPITTFKNISLSPQNNDDINSKWVQLMVGKYNFKAGDKNSFFGYCAVKGTKLAWYGYSSKFADLNDGVWFTFTNDKNQNSLANFYDWNITIKEKHSDGYTESVIYFESESSNVSQFSYMNVNHVSCYPFDHKKISYYYLGDTCVTLDVNMKCPENEGNYNRQSIDWNERMLYKIIALPCLITIAVFVAMVRAGVGSFVVGSIISWYRRVTMPSGKWNSAVCYRQLIDSSHTDDQLIDIASTFEDAMEPPMEQN